MSVALVTCAALPGLADDDRLLLAALHECGVEAEPVVWEDPHVEWERYRLAVIRSVWDYAYRRDRFLGWARVAAERTFLWNPLHVVEWNTHKHYLVDLASRGAPSVPTVVLPAGSSLDLAAFLEGRGWERAVIKAAVAQSGRYARLVTAETMEAAQRQLDRLLPHEDMLLQPYVADVARSGELSLVFIAGELTHAVRKRATGGDFRVHSDYGGSVTVEPPDDAAQAAAQAALDAVDEALLYARVDVVAGPEGPWIMEFELVEPELFLRCSRGAIARFADAIASQL